MYAYTTTLVHTVATVTAEEGTRASLTLQKGEQNPTKMLLGEIINCIISNVVF